MNTPDGVNDLDDVRERLIGFSLPPKSEEIGLAEISATGDDVSQKKKSSAPGPPPGLVHLFQEHAETHFQQTLVRKKISSQPDLI